jgi:hypothetical protein
MCTEISHSNQQFILEGLNTLYIFISKYQNISWCRKKGVGHTGIYTKTSFDLLCILFPN